MKRAPKNIKNSIKIITVAALAVYTVSALSSEQNLKQDLTAKLLASATYKKPGTALLKDKLIHVAINNQSIASDKVTKPVNKVAFDGYKGMGGYRGGQIEKYRNRYNAPGNVTGKEKFKQAKQDFTKKKVNSDMRLWNLKDVDIRTFIQAVSEETGKNFIVDPRVSGKVTFISARPLNTDELYQAFLSALQVNKFVTVPSGSVIKIVPEFVAKGLSSPIQDELEVKDGNEVAVSVVGVRHVPATQLATSLKQFITPSGSIAAYAPTNDLIVADISSNISRLEKLIKQIDQTNTNTIRVIRLRNAQATVLVDTLNSILEDKKGSKDGFGIAPKIAADERTNSILLSGGSKEQREQIRSVITNLDTSNGMPGSVTEVIYIKHLTAERVATIVNALVEHYYESSNGKKDSKFKPFTPGSSSSTSNDSTKNSAANKLFNTRNNQSTSSTGSSSGFSNSYTQDNSIENIVATTPNSGSVSSAVQWEESTNSLIVTAPRDLMRKIKRVIAKIDIRRPQVLIEAVVAEVATDHEKELGIEFNTGGSVQFMTNFVPILPLTSITSSGSLSSGQGMSLSYNGNQVRMLIRALEKDSESNILATPNLVTLDNEPAQIKVGSKVSFATAQIENDPTGGNPVNFFNREDVGLILTINPQITPNGSIKLLIQQELSSIIPNTNSGGDNPDTTERFIRTTVMADNGKILVLGGLLQNEWRKDNSEVPFLNKIPILNALTSDRTKSSKKKNLMIFLRPTILYSSKDNDRVSGGKYEFLRQSQLDTEHKTPAKEMMATPVLPVEGSDVVLPPPFPMLAYHQQDYK